jgi:hypothetical protein
MRDKLKTKEYFEKTYKFHHDCFEEDHDEYKEKLLNEDDNFERKPYYCHSLTFYLEKILYSGYSLGISKNELSSNITKVVGFTVLSWIKDSVDYSGLEFALCIAIIFKMPLERVSTLLNLLEKENYKDFVLDTMANYIDPDFQIRTEKLKFNKYSKPIKEVITLAKTEKKAAVERLKHYLNKEWLNMEDGRINKSQHLRKDESMVYVGYWCIEAAALVIMLDLDDTELKDCAYYPYDLVHG